MPRTRALRGATTVDRDHPDDIRARVAELLEVMLDKNPVGRDDIISCFLTGTPDIHSMFPATAAREAGLTETPLLGASELAVDGAVPLCIRVMLHVETEADGADLCHVYLHDAVGLRTDPTPS